MCVYIKPKFGDRADGHDIEENYGIYTSVIFSVLIATKCPSGVREDAFT